MTAADLDLVPSSLREAFLARGYETLTSVQSAVLDPEVRGRDLRISSQTGSGKTVALGLVLHDAVAQASAQAAGQASGGTVALVLAPTRELAQQVQRELAWLYGPLGVEVATVVGGTAFQGELRALRSKPAVVVGTPGRMRDHLERGTLDASGVVAVVLDEADQMLDLGFRDDLEAILGLLPQERATHLVSATFSREVLGLAARYQRDAVSVEGTRLGAANEDIAHVVHPVASGERNDVLVNLMLLAGDEPTLIFARTREGAATLADELSALGFAAAALTGDMDQKDRTRTLDAFRAGSLRTLVATDVAARGIDVPEVTRVIHADPPGDSETYTPRSGRTGRAGRKGTSILLVPVALRERARQILRRARVEATFRPAPLARDVARAIDERLLERVTTAEPPHDERDERSAAGLVERLGAEAAVRALVAQALRSERATPRAVRAIETDFERPREFERPRDRAPGFRDRAPAFRDRGPAFRDRAPASGDRERPAPGSARPRRDDRQHRNDQQQFVPVRVAFGSRDGADPRKLLAIVCRRGQIVGRSVGAIEVGVASSRVEIAADVADAFARAVRRHVPGAGSLRIEPLALSA